MNKKKVQSIILAGVITANTVCPNVVAYADEITSSSEEIVIEEVIEQVETSEETTEEELEEEVVEQPVEETVDEPTEETVTEEGIAVETVTGNDSTDTTTPPTQTPDTTQVVEVDNETALLAAIKNDANIKLTSNIVLTSLLDIRVNNVTIDGGNFTISPDSSLTASSNNLITVRQTGNTIKNLVIEGYNDANAALLAYNTTNLTLENITCNGVNGKSKAGVDLSGAKNTTLKDIHTSNHYQAGIRLKNGSEVTLLGTNTHSGDSHHLVLDNTTPNIIAFNGDTAYTHTGTNGNNEMYNVLSNIKVSTEQELKDALTKSDVTIELTDNLTLTQSIEIYKDANGKVLSGIEIIGNGFAIDCGVNNKITFKTTNTKISDLTFKNYLNTAISLYGANNVELTDITLEGNDVLLANADRSKVGMDITRSTVTLNNITSKNHTYRGIQVKQNSTVTLNGVKHLNDSIHLQAIDSTSGTPTIKMTNDEYKELKPSTNTNGDKITDYYTKEEISITTAKDLVNNSKNTGTVLVLANDITFTEDMLEELKKLDPHPYSQYENEKGFERDLGLNILKNIEIKGNGRTINLNNICGLVLKGNDSVVEDVKVINSVANGINVYNSTGIKLNKVTVENSVKTGVVANGSIVDMTDCTTINNGEAGIMATRSRTLDNPDNPTAYRDSEITIYGTFEQQESNRAMIIRDLEMIKSNHKQDNKIYFDDENLADQYRVIEKDEVKAKLSLMNQIIFQQWFEDNGISFDKEFGTIDTDIIKVQTRIDVTNQNEYTENGIAIQLVGDGQTDNTENFKKLLRYATLHSKELYFPAGTYLISDDIDLTQLDTWAFSNMTITGDANGLSIIDATSVTDKMATIKNNNYHAAMGYININNMAFNNVGLEFNGIYKNDVSINDNVFMNGKYTKEYDENGTFYKVTMTPYITANNSTYSIERNIFLRGEDYAGRGISTYATKDTVIKDNFFGNLEGSSDAATMLPESVMDRLNLINVTRNVTGQQGNFFTCINNERYDKNMTIKNNYMNMNESREIEGVPSDILITGIDAATEGQRKDHLIYSKGYDGLNIVGNYFKGMENGAAGGVKLRNGVGAYVGSNHFKDVPLLTYIYGDLTKEECKLHDTTIYNNFFHETKNIGGEGTGILYYQSFRNGDTINFPNGETVDNAQADVKNFVVYNNKFLAGEDSVITISNRAESIKDQFLMNGNVYDENGETVGYHKGNMTIEEADVNVVESKLNDGYDTHSTVDIPLYPGKVDNTQLSKEVTDTKAYLESIKDEIGDKEGQYSPVIAEEIAELLDEAEALLQDVDAKQWDINNIIVDINKLIEKLKIDINIDGDMGFDQSTVPSSPNYDVDDEMGVITELPTVEDGTHMDNNMVTPENNNGSNNGTSSTLKPNDIQTLPQTGNESNIILLGIAALASIAGIVLMRKRKKDK